MKNWVVAKFGGSSVKDAEAMLRCSSIVENSPNIKVVVISATQNTTNQLEKIAKAACSEDLSEQKALVLEMKMRHTQIANDVFASNEIINELNGIYSDLEATALKINEAKNVTPKLMDEMYAIGERMSSLIISDLLRLRLPEREVILIDAREMIKTDSTHQRAEPNIAFIAKYIDAKIKKHSNPNTLFVTQGFIGSDDNNATTTLGREGSDYSAALIGEGLDASLVQIWTDVQGIASADPRVVKDVKFMKEISYDEATTLATLGAKVLFPTTLTPTKRKNIPVFVGSSIRPELGGTLVTKEVQKTPEVKAVTLAKVNGERILSLVGVNLLDLPSLKEQALTHLNGLGKVSFLNESPLHLSFKLSEGDDLEMIKHAHGLL